MWYFNARVFFPNMDGITNRSLAAGRIGHPADSSRGVLAAHRCL
jgi:hypothetical protein